MSETATVGWSQKRKIALGVGVGLAILGIILAVIAFKYHWFKNSNDDTPSSQGAASDGRLYNTSASVPPKTLHN